MPYNYDQKTKSFNVYGYFCSWECMKAYNNNENDYNKNKRFSLITMMFYDCNKTFENIQMAPPRQCLKIFGGDMEISEFRSNNVLIDLKMPPLTYIQHNIDKHSSSNYRFINSDEADKQFAKTNNKIKINPIKITETQSNNKTLENILGLFKD
tara:strand:- start:3382 stop:3840 length:459 start_codon:yes stop_codon:yes gene_type:complete